MKVNQIVDSFLRAATLALAYLDLIIFMLPCWRQKDQVKQNKDNLSNFFRQIQRTTSKFLKVFGSAVTKHFALRISNAQKTTLLELKSNASSSSSSFS